MNPTPPTQSYERRDASVVVILCIAGITAAGVALTLLISALYYNHEYGNSVLPASRQSSFTEGSTYRTSVMQQWPTIDAETHKNLTTYQWVDRSQGIVRIPVTRAMSILVDEAAERRKETKPQ